MATDLTIAARTIASQIATPQPCAVNTVRAGTSSVA